MSTALNAILLVEDDLQASEVFTRLYKAAWETSQGQVDFLTVHAWKDAIPFLSIRNIDIILLDLQLVDLTQEQSIEIIRTQHDTLPPIMVVTGDENMEVRKKCISAGAKGFALKKHIFNSPNFFFAEIYNVILRHQLNLSHAGT